MKLIIFGDRKINSLEILEEAIAHFKIDLSTITEIVSGEAKGADTLGEDLGKKHNIKIKQFKPDWKNIKTPGAVIKSNAYGKYNANAGFDRNQQMVEYADCGLALQTNGETNGTQDCIKRLQKAGKPVFIYEGSEEDIKKHEEGQYQF